MFDRDDAILEVARLEREALVRVRVRMAAGQLGEAFFDRRDETITTAIMRGPDRRAA